MISPSYFPNYSCYPNPILTKYHSNISPAYLFKPPTPLPNTHPPVTQCAIVFRTPAYHNADISSPIRVFVELKRKQHAGQVLSGVAEDSVPVTFTYLPRYDLLQQQALALNPPAPATLTPPTTTTTTTQFTLPPLSHARLPSLDQFPQLLVGSAQDGQRKIAVVTTTMMNIWDLPRWAMRDIGRF